MVLNEIGYFLIFGKPLILYLGVITLVLFMITAVVPILNKRGINIISFKWHHRVAVIALTLAIIHGSLGLLAYF